MDAVVPEQQRSAPTTRPDGPHRPIRQTAFRSDVPQAVQDIYNAEDREHAEQAIKTFTQLHSAKFPKAVKKITDDQDVLLEFYNYPDEHWSHLRTTNPIESTFATVRLRTKITKGAGSRAAGLAMVIKLVEPAQARWRAVNGAHLVPLVCAGAPFEPGQLVERPEAVAA
ncbi:transposase [Streptomyces sp. NPDC057387]|uniref:transposase n=1 Tax=Streptomyces sp. NPDC057387 TaxID=3346115 RepID=UPI003625971E